MPSLSPQFPPLQREGHNKGNGEKCHAELVSASKGIRKLRDPETSLIFIRPGFRVTENELRHSLSRGGLYLFNFLPFKGRVGVGMG